MNSDTGKNNILENLKQRNSNSLTAIELLSGETKVISIPSQVRGEELTLLRTAITFQPELYNMISKISTDDQMVEYLERIMEINKDNLEELSVGAEENFGTDSERNQVCANADDQIYSTGWEDSRRIFEQYLATRSGVGIGNSVTGEEVNSADNLKMDSNNHTILGGINSLAESLSRIIDDESEDEEERRKRITAEQNGSDIGTAIGIAVGVLAGEISKEENIEYE